MTGPSWLSRMETRFGDWALPRLSAFIVAMNAAVWAFSLADPAFPALLRLEPSLVLSGQLWRLATFLFIPPTLAPLWAILWFYILFVYARALEEEWGDFRFNAFYAIGAASTVAASLALGAGLSNVPLNATIFLAFARLFPEFEILLFFVLPVKVRWLALAAWAGLTLQLLFGNWPSRLALGAGLLNYALFFGPGHWDDLRGWLEVRRNRARYGRAFRDGDESR